jgi:hypothetical protein
MPELVDPMEAYRQVPMMRPRFSFNAGTVDMSFVDQNGKQACLSLSLPAFCDMLGGAGRVMIEIKNWQLNQLPAETIQVP